MRRDACGVVGHFAGHGENVAIDLAGHFDVLALLGDGGEGLEADGLALGVFGACKGDGLGLGAVVEAVEDHSVAVCVLVGCYTGCVLVLGDTQFEGVSTAEVWVGAPWPAHQRVVSILKTGRP